ncbi:MAG: hypothetical protein JJU28_10900 [Cyclobacteriaceae bacterium]|nr:hypothetical protein [Cyclobacteriaceae bacterium]
MKKILHGRDRLHRQDQVHEMINWYKDRYNTSRANHFGCTENRLYY